MIRRLTLACLLCLGALAPSANAATIWTPIDSGQTGTITAIDYQSPDRFWYATANGRLPPVCSQR